MRTTKEQALFHGLKLLVILLELILLFVSLVPDGDASPKFLSVVLLSALSASLSSIVGLFDDDVFVQYVSWPRFMRFFAVLALASSYVLTVASFTFLCLIHTGSFVSENWLAIALVIAVLCIPRIFVYCFIFAMNVVGMTRSLQSTNVTSDLDKAVREFGVR